MHQENLTVLDIYCTADLTSQLHLKVAVSTPDARSSCVRNTELRASNSAMREDWRDASACTEKRTVSKW